MEQTARPFLRAGLAGLALIAAAAPAYAQSWRPSDKSEAILGAPSSLAAIIAAQAGGTALASALPLTNAVLRPAPLFQPAPLIAHVEAAPDVTAASDHPDVFNSVAMPISRTPLDKNWSRVGSASVGGRAARFAASLRGSDERTRLDAVNRFVNARIAFVDDSRLYGVADRWSAANESLSRGRGDCEDYAIAKLAMLRRAGFADRDLYFVVLKDLSRRADHAVLVVRSGGRFLVLDNGTDQMIDSAAIQDYRPVMTFSAGQRFAHGYRRAITPPVIWASNKVISDPAPMTLATAAGMPSSPFASR